MDSSTPFVRRLCRRRAPGLNFMSVQSLNQYRILFVGISVSSVYNKRSERIPVQRFVVVDSIDERLLRPPETLLVAAPRVVVDGEEAS